MKVIIFNAVSGFGNRLLPIVSIYTWCKQNDCQLGVIWNSRTHRSGLERDECATNLTLADYFLEIPTDINVFANRKEALDFYDLSTEQVNEYDMAWQPQFDTSFLQCDALIVSKCCYVISLFSGNEDIVGQRVDLSQARQNSYLEHPYIEMIKRTLEEFKFKPETIKLASQLSNSEMTGLQLRNTDGGFVKNRELSVMSRMKEIIINSETVYFSNDRQEDLDNVLSEHSNVVAYENPAKFLNNDLGSFHALVDLYALSLCSEIFVSARSSFGLVAHLYSNNAKINYWN